MGESPITGPDLIGDTYEKVSFIRQCLLTAQSRQQRYAGVRRRPLEFEVGDHVFLKVIPKRGVVALPPSMSGVHEAFHVSMLRRYTPDPAHVVDWGQVEIDTDGTFEEGPVCIVDSRDRILRRKTVRLVRVLWRHC